MFQKARCGLVCACLLDWVLLSLHISVKAECIVILLEKPRFKTRPCRHPGLQMLHPSVERCTGSVSWNRAFRVSPGRIASATSHPAQTHNWDKCPLASSGLCFYLMVQKGRKMVVYGHSLFVCDTSPSRLASASFARVPVCDLRTEECLWRAGGYSCRKEVKVACQTIRSVDEHLGTSSRCVPCLN